MGLIKTIIKTIPEKKNSGFEKNNNENNISKEKLRA
jgi:hypothetical protein